MNTIDLHEIENARERLADLIHKTPCLESAALSERCQMRLLLKLETLQHTGSFKPRGALNKILQLTSEEKTRGVIAASAGNHAQGVAFAARAVGVSSLIVMPEATPLVKIANTEALGSRIELHGDNLDESLERAHQLEAEHGYTFVHPFDDPAVIAGQGTVGLEILEQVPEVEAATVATHAMRRLGEPEEIADAISWLCSDRSSFVTGHALVVDGGVLVNPHSM